MLVIHNTTGYNDSVAAGGGVMQAWGVYLNGKLIDTVFYDSDCSAGYVRTGLVSHDGYDAHITVRRINKEVKA